MQRDGISFNNNMKKKKNKKKNNLYFGTAEKVTAPCDVSQLRSFLAE